MAPDVLIILPVIMPLATAALTLALRRRRRLQQAISVASMAASLVVTLLLLADVQTGGIHALQVGSWKAPFGITLVVDHLSAIMLIITAVVGLAVSIYALVDIDPQRVRFGFYPLLHVLIMGVSGAFSTGDLFNMYVWFEVLLIASFMLTALGNRPAQMAGAVKYLLLNLVGSTLFLAAVGLTYGMTGTLNMADLARAVPQVADTGLVTTIATLFLVAFGLKAAVFPLFFWLPAAYPAPPTAVSALFVGLLTKVGVYALLRVFTLIFTGATGYTHTILLWAAGLTMIAGVLGALSRPGLRHKLSFLHISQIGYMVMGLALFTPLALLGSVFYIVHHVFVKTNLFFISGVINRLEGTFDLDQLGGLYRSRPVLSILFLIPAFSLAGFPPLSGFWAKLLLAKAGFAVDAYVIVAVALTAGLATLLIVAGVWTQAFLRERPSAADTDGTRPESGRRLVVLLVPVVALASLTVLIGVFAQPLYLLAQQAATELLDPEAYINTVLGP